MEIYTTVFKAPTFDQILSYYRGEDPLPVEFDDHMRKMMSEMEVVEEFIEDEDTDEDEEVTM